MKVVFIHTQLHPTAVLNLDESIIKLGGTQKSVQERESLGIVKKKKKRAGTSIKPIPPKDYDGAVDA